MHADVLPVPTALAVTVDARCRACGSHDRQHGQRERRREECRRKPQGRVPVREHAEYRWILQRHEDPGTGCRSPRDTRTNPRPDHGCDAPGDQPTRGGDAADHGEPLSSSRTYPATSFDAVVCAVTLGRTRSPCIAGFCVLPDAPGVHVRAGRCARHDELLVVRQQRLYSWLGTAVMCRGCGESPVRCRPAGTPATRHVSCACTCTGPCTVTCAQAAGT